MSNKSDYMGLMSWSVWAGALLMGSSMRLKSPRRRSEEKGWSYSQCWICIQKGVCTYGELGA